MIAGGGPAGAAARQSPASSAGCACTCSSKLASRGAVRAGRLHPGIEPLLWQLGLADRFQATVGARHSGIWLSWGSRRQFQPYGTDQDGAWQGFQVSRTAFDQLLLDYAREQGVEVRQPGAVDRVPRSQENEVRVLTGAGPFCPPGSSWTRQGGQAGFRAGSVLPGARGRRDWSHDTAMQQGFVPGLMKRQNWWGIPKAGSGPPWCNQDCTSRHMSRRMDLGLTRVGCGSICAG